MFASSLALKMGAGGVWCEWMWLGGMRENRGVVIVSPIPVPVESVGKDGLERSLESFCIEKKGSKRLFCWLALFLTLGPLAATNYSTTMTFWRLAAALRVICYRHRSGRPSSVLSSPAVHPSSRADLAGHFGSLVVIIIPIGAERNLEKYR